MDRKPSSKKASTTALPKTITLPALKKGEIYKGLIVDQTGKPLRHVVELTFPKTSKSWDNAVALAKKKGYTLPGFSEGALLRASDPRGQSGWFWLSEPYEAYDALAWAQGFYYGVQDGYHESGEFRVRLVRVIPI